VQHEELWWNLCLLGYVQLYLCKQLVRATPYPWEKYLQRYRNDIEGQVISPSQTQRGLSKLLKTIGSPALTCQPRGKPPGRQVGQTVPKREEQPILRKTIQRVPKRFQSIFADLEKRLETLDTQKIIPLKKELKEATHSIDLLRENLMKFLVDSG